MTTTRYGIRLRARRGDRARIVLALVLLVFTALVGVLGAAPVKQVDGTTAGVPARDER